MAFGEAECAHELRCGLACTMAAVDFGIADAPKPRNAARNVAQFVAAVVDGELARGGQAQHNHQFVVRLDLAWHINGGRAAEILDELECRLRANEVRDLAQRLWYIVNEMHARRLPLHPDTDQTEAIQYNEEGCNRSRIAVWVGIMRESFHGKGQPTTPSPPWAPRA